MSSIEAAIAAIESLEPGEQFSYRRIAEEYCCTIGHLNLARYPLRKSASSPLHPQQEAELLRYIERITRRGLPPTRAMIRNFASQIAKRELGVH